MLLRASYGEKPFGVLQLSTRRLFLSVFVGVYRNVLNRHNNVPSQLDWLIAMTVADKSWIPVGCGFNMPTHEFRMPPRGNWISPITNAGNVNILCKGPCGIGGRLSAIHIVIQCRAFDTTRRKNFREPYRQHIQLHPSLFFSWTPHDLY